MAYVTFNYTAAARNYFICDVPQGTQLTIGESVTIHLETVKYYGTDDTPYLRWTSYGQEYGERMYFTQVDDTHWILTTSFSEHGTSQNRVVQLVGVADKRYCYVDTSSMDQCTSSLPEGQYPVTNDLTFTVTCASNYEFPTTPYLYYVIGTHEYTEELTKVTDQQYQKTLTCQAGIDYFVIAEAVKQTVISDKYGLITAYKVDKDELKTIASRRWIERTWEPQTYQGVPVLFIAEDNYIDAAKYVVSLFKIFIDVESDTQEKLYFGPYDMNMDCDVIPTDIVTLDFGTVEIEGTYQNNIDYEHTEIEAYLPFVGMVKLTTSDFMDKTVRLQYQVNVLDGSGLAMLSADGNVMHMSNCSVAMDIPYQLGGNEYVHNTLSQEHGYISEEAPFIYIKEGNALNPDDTLPYKDTKYYACFGDLSGYTEADEIDFNVLSLQITKTEINEIIEHLQNGVFL